MSEFSALISDLSELIDIELEADDKDSCAIRYPSDLLVQFEVDNGGNYLLMGVELGELGAGRYREDVFEAALKANGAPWPRVGTLAYSTKAGQLVLCEWLPIHNLRAHNVADILDEFVKKAEKWTLALQEGAIPEPDGLELPPGARVSNSPFGLRP